MTYRITLFSNPRLILLIIIMLILPPAGVFGLFNFGLFLGIIALGLAGIIDYHFVKYTISALKTRIDTDEEGIACVTTEKETVHFAWQEITHSGLTRQQTRWRMQGTPSLFLYDGAGDRLLQIPREYSGFDALVEEVRDRTAFTEIHLSHEENLEDRLKEMVG